MQSLWMLFATFMFSVMSVCVKLISGSYSTTEIVMYRSLIGGIFIGVLVFIKKGSFRTKLPLQHLWRGVVGATAFGLWFYSMGYLPIATAVTLNYMSPIWIATILFGISLIRKQARFDWRLVITIISSFVGVALLLKPTIHADQWQAGLVGLCSGVLAALAYLQVRHLGALGEPEYRVVFYFCVTGTIGAALLCVINAQMPGNDPVIFHSHDARGFFMLSTIGITAAIGQMAMTRAYHLGKTLLTANLQYTGIVFSAAWGMLIWNDIMGWSGWLGLMIILCSGVVATFLDVRYRMAATAKKRLLGIAHKTKT